MDNADQLKAWIITVDMGLGHQRAAYPLHDISADGIITAGDPKFTDPSETRLWKRIKALYETISRLKDIPLFGNPLFETMNRMLRIPPLYPLVDLSKPSINNHLVDYLIRRGLGRQFMSIVRDSRLPIITSFYAPALVADYHHYPEIYTVITDSDLNRVWVATKPRESNIFYFAPCGRAMRRLREYGIPDNRIFITGFPLPGENIGGPDMPILKQDLLRRLGRLDPKGKFISVFGATVHELLGSPHVSAFGKEPVTVTFAVGGAGAQLEIAQNLAFSLRDSIESGEFHLNVVVGVNRQVESKFRVYVNDIGLSNWLGNGVEIICEDDKMVYFKRFNAVMRNTDILWTKPSELSFYSALGVPIIAAPTIGSQEDKNLKWLTDKACVLPQYNPLLAAEWLRDMLKDGILAEKAFNGFIKNRKLGIYKIAEVLKSGTMKRESHPLKR